MNLNKRQLEIIDTALINYSNQISLELSTYMYVVETKEEERTVLNKGAFIDEVNEIGTIIKQMLLDLDAQELK